MILRDPVHGLVSFEAPEFRVVERLLECREVQRLRRIRQLGLTSLAYPGADHTRFSHALGTAHVMTRFLARMRDLERDLLPAHRIDTETTIAALSAALLHDVGHGPYSHLFETVAPSVVHHEVWSERIVHSESSEVGRVLREFSPTLPDLVSALIVGKHRLPYLAKAVSGTFDVDRCDYLLRDAHFTGVSYGRFDLDWLLRSLKLNLSSDGNTPPSLAIDGEKGLPAIESFILSRLFMFQQVYFHKASRASEWLLSKILMRLRELILSGNAPQGLPVGLEQIARTGTTSLGNYLELDDPTLLVALAQFPNDKDPILSDLSSRLLARRLFKALELFGENASPEGSERALSMARKLAERSGLNPDYYVGLDVPSIVTFDDQEDPLTVLFKDRTMRKPGDVSFLLSRLRGQVLARPRLIFGSELREPLLSALGSNVPPDDTLAGGTFQTKLGGLSK